MDLEPAFGQRDSFGAWLADQLSSSLASHGDKVEVIKRLRLAAALEMLRLSPRDESIVKNAIALGKSVGATTVIVGSYGAAENGIGVTLAAFRVSDMQSQSLIGMVFGKMRLTQEVNANLSVPRHHRVSAGRLRI